MDYEMPDEITCQECGKCFSDNCAYCPHCGSRKGVTLAESADDEKSDRRRLAELAIAERVFLRVFKWLSIIGAVCLVALGVAGYRLHESSSALDKEAVAARNQITEHAKSIGTEVHALRTRVKDAEKDLESARGMAAQLQSLRSKVDLQQTLIDGFYDGLVREVFGGKDGQGRYRPIHQPGFNYQLTLSRKPIPNSLVVHCGMNEVRPQEYILEGSTLTLLCPVNLESLNASYPWKAVVRYHPAKK